MVYNKCVQITKVDKEVGKIPDNLNNLIAVRSHIDLGHNNKPCCLASVGTHSDRFSLLLGVPSTACPDLFMDNFGVYKIT